MARELRVRLLTKEYPSPLYGGAGVPVEYVARALAARTPVDVRTFGTEESQQGRLQMHGRLRDPSWGAAVPAPWTSVLLALQTCVAFADAPTQVDVAQCHTWYTSFGGILLQRL